MPHTSNPAGSPKIIDTTPHPAEKPGVSDYDRDESQARKIAAVPKGKIRDERDA